MDDFCAGERRSATLNRNIVHIDPGASTGLAFEQQLYIPDMGYFKRNVINLLIGNGSVSQAGNG